MKSIVVKKPLNKPQLVIGFNGYTSDDVVGAVLFLRSQLHRHASRIDFHGVLAKEKRRCIGLNMALALVDCAFNKCMEER